jgi:drug/metabolite transporter (DMT)-like permease
MSTAASLAAAGLAYTLLALGLVLMKKGIGWIGRKGPKDKAFRADLAVWLAGFVLSNLYIVPSAAALKTLSSHVVASFAGWGVVVMVGLAALILKERVSGSDAALAVLVAAAIAVLGAFERSEGGDAFRPSAFGIASLLPFCALAAAFLPSVRSGLKAFLFAAVSGSAAGLIIVAMKVLVRFYGFRIADYLASPYFYAYLIFSLTAFLALQLAYKRAPLMSVGPVQYTAAIAYPVLASIAVFGARLHPAQWAGLAALVFGVAGILMRRGDGTTSRGSRSLSGA